MPPQAICDLYKKYQRAENAAIDADVNVVDFRRGLTPEQKASIVGVGTVSSEVIAEAEKAFRNTPTQLSQDNQYSTPPPCTIYEHNDFPGVYT